MKGKAIPIGRGLRGLGLGLAFLGLLALLVACGEEPKAAAPPGAAPAAPAPAPLKLLTTSPERGPVGTSFTLTGEGLPAARPAEIVWSTADGSYVTKLANNRLEFHERNFVEKRNALGQTTTDAQGRLTATFTTPEDYGGVHDIYVAIDGKDVAKGGFRIVRSIKVSPLEGPLGTPINIEVKGLGWLQFDSTLAVTYDNKYTGFLAATTTRGTARAVIRAAGPVGKHSITIAGASPTLLYLNPEQSPFRNPLPRFVFTVTEDKGLPPLALDWPDPSKVNMDGSYPRTTVGLLQLAAPQAKVTLTPAAGPIRSRTTLQATGLPPGASVDLVWGTVTGNDIEGWNRFDEPLAKATVGPDGTLSALVEIPEDLGGWHAIRVFKGDQALTEAPYFVERSLVAVTPTRVKAGEVFKVQLKGVGWTEVDNGVAVTYDNAYMGYACGFSSKGDVTLNIVATGGPGTHLIDLYPMIYQGHGKPPWSYQTPILSFQRDAPGLALGYNLPVFRLAIEVVE